MSLVIPLILSRALGAMGELNVPPPPVASYELEARLDSERHSITATGKIKFRNPSALPTKELYFHLYLNAFENEKTLFLRQHGGRSGSRHGEPGSITVTHLSSPSLGEGNLWLNAAPHSPGDPFDRTDIRVPLPRELKGHEEIELEIEFVSRLPEVVERTGYAGDFHMLAQWFPKLAKREPDGRWAHFAFHPYAEFYADFGNYDVRMNVPERFRVGSTGDLQETKNDEPGRTSYRATARNVHDFAWTAWPEFVIEERIISGTKVRLLRPPATPLTAARTWKTLELGLPQLGSAYGPYPYPQLTVVHPPRAGGRAGGMEYPQLITTGGGELATLTGVRATELLTIHELGHQWFQGLIATNEYAHPFLDEGVVSFAEWRFLAENYGSASLVSLPWLKVSRITAGRYLNRRSRSTQAPNLPAPDFESFSAISSLVYARTPLCLETLARSFSREALYRALGRYTREQRYRHPGPDEFFSAIEKEMGSEPRRQLEKMLTENAGLDLRVAEVRSQPSDGSWLSHVTIERTGSLELPYEVLLLFESGQSKRLSFDGQQRKQVLIERHDTPLIEVQVDPERRLLVDEQLLNNRWQQPLHGSRAFQGQALVSAFSWLLHLGAP